MKIIKKIFIGIGCILLVLIALIVIVGISITDNTNNVNSEIDNNPKSLSLLINDCSYDALENTISDEKISLLLSEYETNYILDAIKDDINIPFVTLKSLYTIYKDDGTVLLEAPFNFFGFDSCLRGNVDLVLEDDGTFKFILNELSVGKISSNNFLLKLILNSAIDLKNITKSIKNLGIELDLSNDNGIYIASMNKEQMKQTVSNLLNENKIDDLVNTAIEAFIGDNDLFSLKFNDENKIGAILYLKDLAYNQTLEYDLYKGTNNISTLKDKLKILYENKIANYDNLSTIFDYLVRGYEPLSEESKNIIDLLDLSSISIKNNSSYTGIIYRSNLTMAKIFLDASTSGLNNISNIILKGYYDITISEDNLNELFNSLDFIGTSFAFISDDNKIANITISSLFTKLEKEKLTMYLVLDVNGKYINASINASVKNNDGALLSLTIDNINLGNKVMNENVTKYLLDYLSDALKDTDFISIHSESKTMSLDFSSYIEGTFFESLSKLNLNKFSITMEDEKLIFRISSNLLILK